MKPQELIGWRDRLNISQARAARLLGVTKNGYQKWEYGDAPIDRRTFYSTLWLEQVYRLGGLPDVEKKIEADEMTDLIELAFSGKWPDQTEPDSRT